MECFLLTFSVALEIYSVQGQETLRNVEIALSSSEGFVGFSGEQHIGLLFVDFVESVLSSS